MTSDLAWKLLAVMPMAAQLGDIDPAIANAQTELRGDQLIEPSWAFDPKHAVDVDGWSFWIGVIGLVISLVGFGFTIWQLRQTKSLAQAAKDESERIQTALKQYDAAQEASRASYALSAAMKHFRNGAWTDGSENYEDFRRGIASLKNNCDYLGQPIVDRIDDAISYVLKLCERIDKDAQNGTKSIEYAKTAAVIRQQDQLISDLTTIIQRSVIR